MDLQDNSPGTPDERAAAAAIAFHDALLNARRLPGSVGELESAAAQYCREMRRQGHPPERMLREAKRVIAEAIDGDDVPVAEYAVRTCISHYYHTE